MPEHTTPSMTLTVDGKSVTVPNGTTVLQACEAANSPVPFYCYHPGLSIAGNCRICLVEIEGMPKSQIACYLPSAEGMVVHTTSDQALTDRKVVLEFLLANHPLDCPVCDQAGECWLQDYYMEHGLYDPKFNEDKVKKPKMVPIGPRVMLDAERCILCSRCVRFCDEVTKTSEFGIFNRGDHSEIGIFPGKQLDNRYSGNTVDICPVGALTDRDFRFKCRTWYLRATKSVCPGCAMGCTIEIHDNRERAIRPHVAQGARVMRLKPRHNPHVNGWWMCDEGRYGYPFIDQDRIPTVLRRANGIQHPSTWEDAINLMVETFERVRDTKALERVGVVLSTHLTNEDLYIAKRFFQELGVSHVAVHAARTGVEDDLLMKADKSPNTRGAKALGLSFETGTIMERLARKELSVLYVLGCDLEAVSSEPEVREVAEPFELFVFQGSNTNRTAQAAHLVVPSSVYAEKDGTFTNIQGRVQRLHAAFPPLGEAKADWQILQEVAKRLGFGWGFANAEAVFRDLASREQAFRGLGYEQLGEHGAMLAGGEGT